MSNLLPPSDDYMAVLLALAEDPEHFTPPDDDSARRLRLLCREHYVYHRWLEPGYVILPKGLDAISAYRTRLAAQARAEQEREEAKAEERRKEEARAEEHKLSVRRGWIQFFLGLFLGWLLGSITPGNVFSFLVSFFQ